MNGKRYKISAHLEIPQAVMTAMMIELNQHHAGQEAAPGEPGEALRLAHEAIHRSTYVALWLAVAADGLFTVSMPASPEQPPLRDGRVAELIRQVIVRAQDPAHDRDRLIAEFLPIFVTACEK